MFVRYRENDIENIPRFILNKLKSSNESNLDNTIEDVSEAFEEKEIKIPDEISEKKQISLNDLLDFKNDFKQNIKEDTKQTLNDENSIISKNVDIKKKNNNNGGMNL